MKYLLRSLSCIAWCLLLTTAAGAAPRWSERELRRREKTLRRHGRTPRGAVSLLGMEALLQQLPRQAFARFLKRANRLRLHPLVRDHLRLLELEVALDEGRDARARELRRALGLLQRFHVIGPFENEGGVGFAKRYGPELRAGATRLRRRGLVGKESVVSWRPIPWLFPDGVLRLSTLLRPADKGVTYLRLDLVAGRRVRAALRLGTNCSYRIWLGGDLVASRKLQRRPSPDQDTVGLTLKRGRNALLIKLAADATAPTLVVRLTALRGGALAGVTAEPPRYQQGRGGGVSVFSRLGAPIRGPRASSVWDHLEGARKRRPKDAGILEDGIRYLLEVAPDDARGEEARARALALVKLRPSAVAYRLLARASHQGNDQRRALIRALKLDPRDALAADGLGDFYYGAGRHHTARRYWTQAIRADPGLLRTQIKLAELAQVRRLPVLAIRTLRALAKRWPTSDDVLKARASLEAGRGHAQRAVTLLTDYVGRHRRDLSALTLLTSLEQRRLRHREAQKWLRWQIRAQPERLRPRVTLAQSLAANGDPRGALSLLQRALVQLPRSFQLRRALGDTALLAGLDAAARMHYTKALALRPQALGVKRLLAYLERKGPDPLVKRYARDGHKLARAAWKRRRSQSDAEVLLDTVAYQVLPSGLSRRFHQRLIKIETTKGVAQNRSHTLDYLPDTQHVEVLVARVIRRDGSEVEASQHDVQMNDPAIRMYYDRRLRVIRFPSVRPGDVVEIQTLLADVPASNMFKDYFGTIHPLQGPAPIRELQLVVELPPKRSIRFNKPGLAGLTHKVRRTPQGTIHRWSAHRVPEVTTEPLSPGWAETHAHLHLSTFQTWRDVARWYWGLVERQYHADAALKRAAREATRNARTVRDKVLAVYDLVVKKTRYVALAFGVHTYKPYSAPAVFARKFGDCKDKAMLMAVLLKEVGVVSHPVLLRTRRGGRLDTRIPSLAPFDHAILYVPKLKLWLDGTAESTSAAALPHADQGTMALVVDGKDGRLVTTPVLPATSNLVERKLTITLAADGSARVHERRTVRGQEAAWWRQRFTDPALRRDHFEKLITQTFPGAKVSSVKISDPEDLRKPVTVEARYQVPGLATTQGGALSFDLELSTSSSTSRYAPLAKRRLPLEYAYPWARDTAVTVRWPATLRLRTGLGAARAQALGSRATPWLSFEQTIGGTATELRLTRRLRVARHRYTPKEYGSLRAFWLDVDKAQGGRVVLGKGGTP